MAAMLKSVHKESKSHLTASVVAKQDISLTTASYERKWPTFYYRLLNMIDYSLKKSIFAYSLLNMIDFYLKTVNLCL